MFAQPVEGRNVPTTEVSSHRPPNAGRDAQKLREIIASILKGSWSPDIENLRMRMHLLYEFRVEWTAQSSDWIQIEQIKTHSRRFKLTTHEI